MRPESDRWGGGQGTGWRLRRALWLAAAASAPYATGTQAQLPPDLARERAAYASWLATAPVSPYAALALQPVGRGITLGSGDGDIPVAGLGWYRVTEDQGLLRLWDGTSSRPLRRGRPTPLGGYTLLAGGPAGRAVVALFGPARAVPAPDYYPYAPEARLTEKLEPPERRGSFVTLGLDGMETEAVEAGFFPVRIGSARARLRVYQLRETSGEEVELYIYFRDQTNGRGTYPAGRFVELLPAGSGRFLLDFNRARNPFCAYSSVYPCPAPWPGNGLSFEVRAGERYLERGTE